MAIDQKLRTRFEIVTTTVLTLAMLFFAAVTIPLAAYSSHLPAPEILCLGLPFALLAGLGLLITLLITKRWKLAAVAGCALAASLGLLAIGSESVLRSRFARSANVRGEAVSWVRSQSSQERRFTLPTALQGLTIQGEAARHTEGNKEWIFLPMIHYFLDDESGFAWSNTGEPPPEGARNKITGTESLGDGWFIYRST